MVDRGVPRHGYPIVHDGVEVGFVTSGMFAPTSQRYLGMAYLPPRLAKVDTEIEIMVRDKARKAVVVQRPFYVPAYRR
jgi:aminomethyltransferase